ncbi:MAG TPA: YceH family protein [Desulfuromonadales bacterium]|nr:YceH family protein [Desulfuromonadales bacterium]
MDIILNDIEVRVLGSLIEKELTTPEYYPLSLNALTNACNQKSNRDPAMTLAEEEVVRALDSLRFKQLAVLSADGGRVPKYRHLMAEKSGLMPAELAIICELLVRGPQTVGELRTRGERMHPFGDLAAVEEVLQELLVRETPLITLLPRQSGRKEGRYAQLFSGIPENSEESSEARPEPARQRVVAENERVAKLEAEVASLREEILALRRLMEEFKKQFE